MLYHLRQSFSVAVLAGTAFALNNPTGHSFMQEAGLRGAYASELEEARKALNLPDMDFNQFRELAPIALTMVYNGDRKRIEKAIDDLGGTNPFCLPTSDGDEENPKQLPLACHAVCSRKNSDKEDKVLKLNNLS